MKPTISAASYYRSIVNAMPVPFFVVDGDLRLLDSNAAAAKLLKSEMAHVLHKRGGDVLHCLHSIASPAGCGHSKQCGDCMLRKSVSLALSGVVVHQHKIIMELLTPTGGVKLDMMVTATPLQLEGKRQVLLSLEDVTELLDLRAVIPICSHCKSIRDDQQAWQKLETYLHTHLRLDFSHGLCPECTQELFPNHAGEKAGRKHSPTTTG